jgi:hypothetical protein
MISRNCREGKRHKQPAMVVVHNQSPRSARGGLVHIFYWRLLKIARLLVRFSRLGMIPGYKGTMHIQSRYILTIAALAFASGLPNQVSADELREAKVTQVIQDVRVLPSNASPRAAAVNDNVHQGTAVQTGVQSRSELTFKDQTITRLGEKTIFNVGDGRAIDLGSGQFLLYAPKKAGGAKVKMGPVTAAISG